LDVIDFLKTNEVADLNQLAGIVKVKSIHSLIKKMIEKGIIYTQEELQQKYSTKTAPYLYVHEHFRLQSNLVPLLDELESKTSSQKQAALLMRMIRDLHGDPLSEFPIAKKEITQEGYSVSTIQTLVKKEIIVEEQFEVSRLKSNANEYAEVYELSEAQEKAKIEIQNAFEQHKTVLLHGVTGSGKTEIYVHLIQEALNKGKQVLFLLPEIALTTQLINRLAYFFGDLVGIYHSKFNQNERVEIWNHVLTNNPNKYRVVVGARSSVFLPFQDLGLIIVDEEHESSYKQYDPAPRYNGRDSAIILAHIHDCSILLGSATPSLESYHNAKSGKYGLVTLTDRFGNIRMPEVLCADLKKEHKQKSMHSHFSSFLMDEMKETLTKGEQVILFQNRRGYTPSWSCEVCAWTPKCKNCDVSLTYHKFSNQLKCHYCGHTAAPVGTCGSCGSNRIKMNGFGTEKIEDELSLIFPDKKIQRLDMDSTRSKNAYSEIIEGFENREIDILVGTQMVTKGLDFDHVSLVGVLDAELLLNRPDYRALERAFQLMTQVAGRAGRKNKRGKVIIQTKDPDHWVLEKVQKHDFVGFYEHEIIERKQYFYPPYFKFLEITLKHKDDNVLNHGADVLAQNLRNVFKERVLGPEFPMVKRIQNYYLKQISLKIEKDVSDKQVKETIQNIINEFYLTPLFKSIRVNINVDPM
jgi:primosomal protein N' (replication factor Y)